MTLRVSAVSASAAWPQITGIKSRLSTNYQHPPFNYCTLQPAYKLYYQPSTMYPFPDQPPNPRTQNYQFMGNALSDSNEGSFKAVLGQGEKICYARENFVSLAVVVPKRQLKSRHLFQANDSCKPVISFYSISAAHICSQRVIYKPGWPRTSQLGASCSTLATAAIRVVSVSGLKTNPSHSSCLKCLYDESVQLVLLSIGGRRCN